MKNDKPIIAITMGDCAGIGPEIIMKALNYKEVYEQCNPIVIGDMSQLIRIGKHLNSNLELRCLKHVEEAKYEYGTIDCIDMNVLSGDVIYGEVSAEAGDAAFKYIERAVQMARDGSIDAICTAPLNKAALHKAGRFYPGHTEILADLSNTEEFAMMFSSKELNVILVTIHEGLIDAIHKITPQKVYTSIKLVNEMMVKSGVEEPQIAVCAINPHAGENGLFGNGEEEEKIIPAIEKALKEGIKVSDPLPADSAFYLSRINKYDAVVSMYHDQGLGPLKVLGFGSSVNITLGLPFIRTSVDHGTAYNIAGKGIADESNMKEAILHACLLSNRTSIES